MRRLILPLVALCFASQLHAQRLLLKDATIIDGDAAVRPYRGSILIEKDKIVRIFTGDALSEDKGVQVLNCSGKYVVPGMIDAHVHLATMSMADQRTAHRQTDSILHNMLQHGITTVRDMAGDAIFLAEYKRAIATRQLSGPAIFYAAQFAGPSYFALIGNGGRDGHDLGNSPWYCAVTSATDMPLAIAAAKGAGVSGIKVYADLDAKLVAKITAEAHRQGLQVWSHAAVFPAKPMDAVKAGVNSMSHANDMSFQQLPGDTINISKAWDTIYKGMKMDVAIQRGMLLDMKRKRIFLDPTVYHASQNKMVNALDVTKLANQLGVQLVTGTDWIYPTAGAVPLLDEFNVLMKSCGLTPIQVIQSATLNGARVIGLTDRGQLKAGMRADLLILSEDPLKNIAAMFSPEGVMVEGRLTGSR